MLLTKIKQVFDKCGKREITKRGRFDPKPKFREAFGDIVIGVLGYPNVGKSSIINALAHMFTSQLVPSFLAKNNICQEIKKIHHEICRS